MMIAVMLKGALKDSTMVVVPLETTHVKPDIASIKASCNKELRMLYPFDIVSNDYDIIGLDVVIAKIASCNQP